jgi:dihydroneopterin aldolase
MFRAMKSCGTKITSACNFIDFFVHDVLDYTMLYKNAKNFVKNMELFDVKEAVQDIVQILEDKMNLRDIGCKLTLHDFGDADHSTIVKSDQKRL